MAEREYMCLNPTRPSVTGFISDKSQENTSTPSLLSILKKHHSA